MQETSECMHAMPSSKHICGCRKTPILLVLAFCGTMLVGWAVMEWRSMSRSPDRLDLMASVKPDTKFWIYKRMPGTRIFHKHPFPRDQAVAVLQAMSTALPWEPGRSIFSCRIQHVHTPGEKSILVWGKEMDMNSIADLEGNHLGICHGNAIFTYGHRDYVVPAEGREMIDRIFPREEE
jgi:hypothetical protein